MTHSARRCLAGLLSFVDAGGEGRCKVARRWTPRRSRILLGAASGIGSVRVGDVGRPVFAGLVVSRDAWPAAVGASSDASTLPPSATSSLTDCATLAFGFLPMDGFMGLLAQDQNVPNGCAWLVDCLSGTV